MNAKRVETKDGKLIVIFKDKYVGHELKWIPSFVEIGVIIWHLYQIEEEKYPKEKGFKGGNMMLDFLSSVVSLEKLNKDNVEKLKKEYKFKK